MIMALGRTSSQPATVVGIGVAFFLALLFVNVLAPLLGFVDTTDQ